MKISPIKQRDASACGPASIQMVLTYFKLPNSFKRIAEISQYKKRDGLSNKDLVEALRVFDLTVRKKNQCNMDRFSATQYTQKSYHRVMDEIWIYWAF